MAARILPFDSGREALTQPAVPVPPLTPLAVVPARPLDPGAAGWLLIPLDQIAYFFLGSAVGRRLIQSRTLRGGPFRSSAVYLRTVKGGLFRTNFRTLAEALARVDCNFISVHQSLVINLSVAREVYPRRHDPAVGIRIAGLNDTDYLRMARRRVAPLLARLGFASL